MLDLKIEISGVTRVGVYEECVDKIGGIAEEKFPDLLGKLLYSFEEKGYIFTTGKIYERCMDTYHNSQMSSKFTILYSDFNGESNDRFIVSVRVAKG